MSVERDYMIRKHCRTVAGLTVVAFVAAALYFAVTRISSYSHRMVEFDSGQHLVMGTFARVVAVASDSQTAQECIEAAFEQLTFVENLCSVHREDSEISKCNRNAYGTAVKVSEETFEVLQKALKFSRRSAGAFDITVGPLVELWCRAAEANSLPTKQQLTDAVGRVGYDKLILDTNTGSVRFAVEGMKLDLGGIAKGYAIDKAVEAMEYHGAAGGMVDVGGDIRCFGTPPAGREHWLIGLQDPARADNALKPVEVLMQLKLPSGIGSAVTTSGDYRRFVLIEGQRYSHIINTLTGHSSEGLPSVTIICENAADSDALATAVSVMGVKKGLALIEKMPQTEAILVTSGPESKQYLTSGAQNYINTESIDY